MLASKSISSVSRSTLSRAATPRLPAARLGMRNVTVRALDDTNFAINILASITAAAVVAGVTTVTAENRDKEIEKITSLDTWTLAPIGAAVAVDTVSHSIPGLNILFALLSEPAGACCGVAYMMTLILSTARVNPGNKTPTMIGEDMAARAAAYGTQYVTSGEKAEDSRAALRVPFTNLISTALKVVDFENSGSSGAGWTIGEGGLPRLPINSVLISLAIGGTILEFAAHAPVLSLFLPRVLQFAAAYAAAGYAIEYFGLNKEAKA